MKNYTFDGLFESQDDEILEILDALNDDEIEVVKAILELKINGNRNNEKKIYEYTVEDLQDAIDQKEDTIYYMDIDSYYDSCDDLLEFSGNSIAERYFDYDAYHRDCMFDATEASNGVVIADY